MHHRPGELLGSAHHRRPERRAAASRLDHQRKPQPVEHGPQQRVGAELAERLVRQHHRGRGAQPRPLHDGLGGRLVEGDPARAGLGADVGQPEQLQHRAQRPVLTGHPVQHREDRIGPVRAQRAQQPGVDVALLDLQAGVSQRLGHPPPGAQRHVALVGEPAGEDKDRAQRRVGGGNAVSAYRGARVWFVHDAPALAQVRSGPGPCRRSTTGTAPGPKVVRSSSSRSMTPASRRTPSAIRSGVG